MKRLPAAPLVEYLNRIRTLENPGYREDLSIRGLARDSNVNERNLHRYLAGQQWVRPETVDRFACELGLHPMNIYRDLWLDLPPVKYVRRPDAGLRFGLNLLSNWGPVQRLQPPRGVFSKVCSKCGETLPVDFFPRNGKWRRSWCKNCDILYRRVRYRASARTFLTCNDCGQEKPLTQMSATSPKWARCDSCVRRARRERVAALSVTPSS